MKRIIFLLLSIGLVFQANSQTITDTATLRANINANIVPNAIGSITAAKLNTILIGNITAFKKIGVTSLVRHPGTDSVFYIKDGVETFVFLLNPASGLINNSGSSNRLAYYASSGTAISALTAISGNKALISDATGLPTHSITTSAELGYLSGTTSSVQAQFNNRITSVYRRSDSVFYVKEGVETFAYKDSTAAGVSSISSLGGQTGATQTFSKVDDTNVTLGINSATNNHAFTLGWTGTLADGRIASASAWNAKPGGSGTNGYAAIWTGSNTLGTGATRDDGNSVGIGMAPAGVNGSLSLLANLYLPNSTSTLGSIYKNGTRWLHNSGGTSNNNIYLGQQAGNDSTGAQNFLNVGLGFGALNKVSGFGNIGIGYSAGGALREWDGSQAGSRNIFIGYEAGLNAIGASHTVVIGAGAGANLQYGGYSQVLIGKSVGHAVTTGTANTFVGSAITTTTGEWNVALGPDALQSGTSASYNMIGGAYAASALTTGYGNVMLGNRAGSGVTTGDNNVLLGQYAGNVVGTGNVMIGGFAAAYEAGLNNKLVIDGSLSGPSRHTINGDFATHQVGIDRTLAELAAASGYKFQVNGSMYATTNIKLGGLTLDAGMKDVRMKSDSTLSLVDTVITLSDTYTPTLTNVTNVSASTVYSFQYTRVANVVTVSGEVDIDPTTTATLTQLRISLPIASALTASNELSGTSADDLGTTMRVAGDATNDAADLRGTPVDVTNRRFSVHFTYRVL